MSFTGINSCILVAFQIQNKFVLSLLRFSLIALIQISFIENCKMEQKFGGQDVALVMDAMPIDFYDGACNVYLEPTPTVLLCFSAATKPRVNRCHT